MTNKISFSDTVSVLEIEPLNSPGNKINRKRKKTPSPSKKHLNLKYYNQNKAFSVASRIELELNNDSIFEKRLKEELIVENLLCRYQFYTQINKVYRLSNDALHGLKKRLILHL